MNAFIVTFPVADIATCGKPVHHYGALARSSAAPLVIGEMVQLAGDNVDVHLVWAPSGSFAVGNTLGEHCRCGSIRGGWNTGELRDSLVGRM